MTTGRTRRPSGVDFPQNARGKLPVLVTPLVANRRRRRATVKSLLQTVIDDQHIYWETILGQLFKTPGKVIDDPITPPTVTMDIEPAWMLSAIRQETSTIKLTFYNRKRYKRLEISYRWMEAGE